MKNKELHCIVNIQEDEDGYALYRGNTIIDNNGKLKKNHFIVSPNFREMNVVTGNCAGVVITGNDYNYKSGKIR